MDNEAQRLEKRLERIRNCAEPISLSFEIWTTRMEKAIGSSRQEYRNGFVDWIESYKNRTRAKWIYRNPEELANSVWPPYLDREDDSLWFIKLRIELVKWINRYSKR